MIMAQSLKKTEQFKVFTDEEALALIAKIKEDENNEGYEVIKYSVTLKEKKSKGEVIDAFFLVEITKRWSE